MLRKKVLAALLSVGMILSVVACGNQEQGTESKVSSETNSESTVISETAIADELDWLDRSGNLPLVKEGTEKSLTVAVRMRNDSGDPEDTWAYQFMTEVMNIDVEIIKFTDQNAAEYRSLTFADGDLPDIIIGGGLSAGDLVKYGAVEGQLLDLAPYINEEYMPNLAKLYAENAHYKTAVTDTEGHIYSLGYINDPTDKGQLSRAYIRYDWLEEDKLEVPTTLDDFVNMLRVFKKRGDDVYPLGGAYNASNPCVILLSAFGYNTPNAKGTDIATRNGEVVLPIADREAYGAYLTTMHTLYEEGLINPDFYTIDANSSNAVISSGKAGFVAEAPGLFMNEFNLWWGAKPLTSEYNDTQLWPASTSTLSIGGVVVSAECEEIELALAFIDWFYEPTSQNYTMMMEGPASNQTEYLLGEPGFDINPETHAMQYSNLDTTKYANKSEYVSKKMSLWNYRTFGLGVADTFYVYQRMAGTELVDIYPERTPEADDSNLRNVVGDLDTHFRLANEDTLAPHVEVGIVPKNIYLDAETSAYVTDLLTVVREYGEQESAKFVTGARPLSELEQYFDEIEKLGALEIVEIYAEHYNAQ